MLGGAGARGGGFEALLVNAELGAELNAEFQGDLRLGWEGDDANLGQLQGDGAHVRDLEIDVPGVHREARRVHAWLDVGGAALDRGERIDDRAHDGVRLVGGRRWDDVVSPNIGSEAAGLRRDWAEVFGDREFVVDAFERVELNHAGA